MGREKPRYRGEREGDTVVRSPVNPRWLAGDRTAPKHLMVVNLTQGVIVIYEKE